MQATETAWGQISAGLDLMAKGLEQLKLPSAPTRGGSASFEPGYLAATARRYLKLRRLRDALGDGLFHDPAWDILLDLFAADIEGERISVTSACIASAVPPTTAIRTIGILEDRGLVNKSGDRHDGRRRFLAISGTGRMMVEQFLRQMVS